VEEEWQEKVCNREEWKKLLRTAMNCCIMYMEMEQWNSTLSSCKRVWKTLTLLVTIEKAQGLEEL
jgi:hypothetical protein